MSIQGAVMRLNKVLKSVLLSISVAAAASSASAVDITGAGSTFAYPMFSKWAEVYKKSNATNLNYQSIGSGGGIKQIKAKTVDFGASDMPLKFEDMEAEGLLAVPGGDGRRGADRQSGRRDARSIEIHRRRAGEDLSGKNH